MQISYEYSSLKEEDKKLYYDRTQIYGDYKLTRYSLNREHGSVFDKWMELGAPENMTKEEIEYLNGQTYPKMDVEYLELSGRYNKKIFLPPHGIELFTFKKITK
ncbi:hypothetical protein CULT_50048 [[Clostridium] ultunense Esp]|uniref:Uncharacterized protein n=1 Tax=[Clostridium] ultunense Esp TaxID=1288971 RepID=M1ZES6_9FIRM|nr:hypothetical protein [Schnuerera ultunensis]CCQ96804.1 hypothetical protein CULT_50048 [[Clostridium] ultunense Esp]SHD75568.1 conserved protein of unknown function [[Clostridium] ultunense Esp]